MECWHTIDAELRPAPLPNDLASELTHYMTISSVYMDMEIRQRVGKKMSLEKKRVVVVKGLLPLRLANPAARLVIFCHS